MNILDIIIIAVIFLSMLQSYRSGFLGELLTLIFFGLSAYFAYTLAPLVMPYLNFISDKYIVLHISAIIILFIIFYIVGKILTEFILDITDEKELNGFDHFIGMLLGLAKGIIIVCLIIWLVSYVRVDKFHALMAHSFISHKILCAVAKYKNLIFI